MIACVAVIGKKVRSCLCLLHLPVCVGHPTCWQNNPLLLRVYVEANDILKFHFIVHASLDMIDDTKGMHSVASVKSMCLIQRRLQKRQHGAHRRSTWGSSTRSTTTKCMHSRAP